MGAGFVLLTPALPLDKVLLDIHTREIFGHDTKNGGFYYVDDVATNRVIRTGSTETSQHRWIWLESSLILAAARALLLGMSVPKQFWLDAVTYAVYLLNRLPSRVLEFQSPMQEEPTEPAKPAIPAEPTTPVEPAILTYVITVTEPITPHEVSLMLPDQAPMDIPEEAFNDPKWAETMNIEMEALQKNNT
ncbi:unnamed protein product [Prunus armeniaca]